MPDQRRPIKIVIPDDKDFHPVPPGGSRPKEFGTVDAPLIDSLNNQISSVERAFGITLQDGSGLPAVACVRLKKEAIAKSHRPTALFNQRTCPIIGVQDFGELFVSVSKRGIDQLRSAIRNPSQDNRAAVSTIKSIEPFSIPNSEYRGQESDLKKHKRTLKIRLFNHMDQALNRRVVTVFSALVRRLTNNDPTPIRYARALQIYKVSVANRDAELALSGFVGVQELGDLPGYEVDTQAVYIEKSKQDSLPPPTRGIDYPIIGLLDSGTDPDNENLQAWVVGRDEEDVPRADQDNAHGSFVAGLLINARGLNHGDPRFPDDQCKIFDAVVFPKKSGTAHPEDILIGSIRRVIEKHHKRIKVWNLSISEIKNKCRDDRFSDFAMALDEIQDQYDVTIVTCTGNAKDGDFLRAWPCSNGSLGETDRMFPASDSVRAITVASLAHQHRHDSLAKSEEPSPFSRRGPAPAFVPKPELSHYGGNCNNRGGFQQTGILSVDNTEMIVERVGTSYAAPLVSKILGSLRDSTTAPISRNLGKALIIHSAVLAGRPVNVNELRYRGFGVPRDVEALLNCPPWQATLIFEPVLEPVRRIFDRRSFPIPPCFRRKDRSVQGEFVMTLVYDPPVDPTAGAEYCRVNVDVSLGTFDVGKDGKRHHMGKIPLEPADAHTLYEEYQLEHGFKWSPLKVYRKRLERTGGDHWRIFLRMFHRGNNDTGELQNVALVVTMQDPQKKADVYNEVVREMNLNGWVTQNLEVRERGRIGPRA
jgi:serine protease AprX